MKRRKLFLPIMMTMVALAMLIGLAVPAMAAEVKGTKETYLGGDPANTADKVYVVGETIYYTMTVENPVTNTRINTMTRIWDTMPDGTVIEFLAPGQTLVLMPGEIATFQAEYLVKPDDVGLLENTFEALGYDNATPAPDTLRVLITKNALVANPQIAISKTASHAISKVGDIVNYTITVTNTGDFALENMVVMDALLGGNITAAFAFDASLAPGASKTAVIPHTIVSANIVNGVLLNTATVSAHALAFPGITVSDQDQAEVAIVTPSFTIAKTADTAVSKTGDTVNYTVTVTNTSDVNMEFLVTDSMAGELFDGMINSGTNKVFTYAYVVKIGDYPGPLNNVVTAVATLEWLNLDNVYTQTATVDVPLVTPAVTITKTVNTAEAYIGDIVTYTIRVQNTGDWALENMVVNDTMFGNITAQFGFDTTLAVGAYKEITIPYTIQSTDYPGTIVNTADVYANPVGLPNDIIDEDSAVVNVVQKMCYASETAWAFGGNRANPTWDYTNSRNWGWTNGPLAEGDYVFDIYAAAGQNDLSKGTLVGELHVSYHGGTVTVTYKMFDQNYLSEVHLWVGSTPLPQVKQGKNTRYTNAPGQFPFGGSDGFVSGTNQTEWTWTGTGFTGNIFVAAHSVVQIAIPCPIQ